MIFLSIIPLFHFSILPLFSAQWVQFKATFLEGGCLLCCSYNVNFNIPVCFSFQDIILNFERKSLKWPDKKAEKRYPIINNRKT